MSSNGGTALVVAGATMRSTPDAAADARYRPAALVGARGGARAGAPGAVKQQAFAQLQSRHIPVLDGWRGVAVLSVMAYHLWPWQNGHCAWFTSYGWMGVDLFFVLSGFLITRILLAAREQPHYFRNFYARRTLRIFPLYYAVVLAVAVLWPMLGPHRQPARQVLPHAAIALTYLTNLWQCWHQAWYTVQPPFRMGHVWSLAVEEQFYLIWPVVVLLAVDRRWLLAACAACVAIAEASRAVLWVHGVNPIVPFVFTPCRLDGLAIGAALAVAATQPRWTEMALRASRIALWVTLPMMLLIGLRSHGLDHNNSRLVRTVGMVISAPLCASALFLTVTAGRGSWPNRTLNFSPLRWFGKYSYGLYVYHGLLMAWLHVHVLALPWWHSRWLPSAELCEFLAMAGICTVISVLSYHFFEQPLLRLKRFFPEPMSPNPARQPRV